MLAARCPKVSDPPGLTPKRRRSCANGVLEGDTARCPSGEHMVSDPEGLTPPNPLVKKEGRGDKVPPRAHLSPLTLGRAKVGLSRLAAGRGWAHSPSHVAVIGAWKESEWLEIQEARCDRCR